MILLKLPREQKQLLISDIQAYIEAEWGESIGELAAGNLLDFMLQELGPHIYNQAIRDAKDVVLQGMERVEEDVSALAQPLHRAR
ncbi:DUF2164 domain-containing protein [Alicyclobacillus cycloheptanicus]|uniref:Uncharacterized protein (DUF2164 family) n=1 Tax=Alicyclobacillus cycloheptanicus TaxID=1457 RepID=A0ABT9XH35_9BACL|nr:DUF2164 domain-containing protein [Alicyclobacillus cycloheptanicus]MDQ0189349.1 uncharacterized protein (DUF2164 family) [Alicyclobacillus cycloheptanicus]WDM01297.1 DUF2164 domain-containing protein [Alicyclobacillus cycloheptanicus]